MFITEHSLPHPYTQVKSIIYVAAPTTLYWSPRYDQALATVHTLFPGTCVLDARSAWASDQDWLRRWPELLPTVETVVVVTDEGWIGYGVFTEVNDALAISIPVLLLDGDALHPWNRVTVIEQNPNEWRRYMRVTRAHDES
jgi:hypothetical protein